MIDKLNGLNKKLVDNQYQQRDCNKVISEAKKKLKEKPRSVVVVGDQVYTDVLGANLAGMKSILLMPQSEEHGFTIYVRRKLETGIRRKLKVIKRGEEYVVK